MNREEIKYWTLAMIGDGASLTIEEIDYLIYVNSGRIHVKREDLNNSIKLCLEYQWISCSKEDMIKPLRIRRFSLTTKGMESFEVMRVSRYKNTDKKEWLKKDEETPSNVRLPQYV